MERLASAAAVPRARQVNLQVVAGRSAASVLTGETGRLGPSVGLRAVLVAKLSLGALALNDVWFGGQTKNPWNLDEGASGSSAGPGSAVAAGRQ